MPKYIVVALVVAGCVLATGCGGSTSPTTSGSGNSSNAAKTAPVALCNSLTTTETQVDSLVTADRSNGATSPAALQTILGQLTGMVQPIVTQSDQSVPSSTAAGQALDQSIATLNTALTSGASTAQITADVQDLKGKWFDYTNAVSKHCPAVGH